MPGSGFRCARWVDPFIGTEAVDLPEPEGIAATWFYLKAQIGNTHPGACLPFSAVSACPYSGAYLTGYGRYGANTHGSPPRIYDTKGAFGVTHVHHSGTGYISAGTMSAGVPLIFWRRPAHRSLDQLQCASRIVGCRYLPPVLASNPHNTLDEPGVRFDQDAF